MGMGPANQQSGMGGKGAGMPTQTNQPPTQNQAQAQAGMGGKGAGPQVGSSLMGGMVTPYTIGPNGQPVGGPAYQGGMGGKGGPQQGGFGQQLADGRFANQMPQDNSQQAYNNFMAQVSYGPGVTPPTYEQWAAQRQQGGMVGKGGKGAEAQQGPDPQAFYDAVGYQPQPPMQNQMQPGMGGKGMGPQGMGFNRFIRNNPYINDRFDGNRFSRNLDKRLEMPNARDRFRGK